MRMRTKTVMEQMNAEKPDDVLADLEAKHGSRAAAGSAFVSVDDALPIFETDRDHPGDTVSSIMDVRGPFGQEDQARFHFPTGKWCWRDSSWTVMQWGRPNTEVSDGRGARSLD